MNNITLALLLIFLTLKASAFDLDKVAVPSSFLNKPYVVVDVIDARTSTYIGERHDYGFDSIMYAPSGSLNSFVYRLFKSGINSSSETESIVIRINYANFETRFYEGKNYGGAGINLSFLKQDGTQYIELFQAAEHREWEGYDLQSHSENISALFGQAINSFNKQHEENRLTITVINEENVLDVQFRIPPTTFLRKGLYLDYYSYRENRPDTQYHATYTKKYKSFTNNSFANIKLQGKNKTSQDFYGFHDGQHTHYRIGEDFVPMTIVDDQQFIQYLELTENDRLTAVALGIALGPIVGTFISKGIIHNRHYDGSAPYYDANTFTLDPRTGRFIQAHKAKDYHFMVDLKKDETPTKDVYIIVENFSKKKQTVEITGSDIKPISLTRGKYQVVEIPQSEKTTVLTFSTPSDAAQSFILERVTAEMKIIKASVNSKGELEVFFPKTVSYDSILEYIETERYELAVEE
ncbi:MAG: hypothetical protein NWQ55_11270 [Salibacteraceae bacterium]|jgi:hypothetical protein|nr:hypothetical protein [Salibacteraceae bacterium]MDP4686914.1 hypothetical protein [Salibacteraceae bacterium]MDP4763959.1 hypothetical protein [Salibacteraceae bacterium]MDP4845419.1 hypothetical protein [Salibacteraceae bacterium]MDP4965649.1 hypothetical protein [Salibacteraceae bacterium]